MKRSTLPILLAVAGAVVAHPHHMKREMVTQVVWTTVTVANVVVWVDDNGVPYATTTVEQTSVVPTTLTQTRATTTQSFSMASSDVAVTVNMPVPMLSSPVPSSEEPAEISAPVVTVPFPLMSSTIEFSTTTQDVSGPSLKTSSAASSSSVIQFSLVGQGAASVASSTTVQNTQPTTAQVSGGPAPSATVQVSSSSGLPIGITYDPYVQGGCKSSSQISNDFGTMFNSYGIVRIYGDDCGMIPIAVQQATNSKKAIFAGIYMPDQDVTGVVNKLIDAVTQYANGNWSVVSLVSVENERINAKNMTASAVVDGINKARSALRYAGYGGPVGAVETVPATVDNPTICDNSDIVLVNSHAFFDSNTKAEDAGTFVQVQVQQVQQACGGKRVIVTESGWPWQGNTNGQAVPSRPNQKTAIQSLLSAFSQDLFLFNAFDDMWKSNDATTFNAEQYWGIMQ